MSGINSMKIEGKNFDEKWDPRDELRPAQGCLTAIAIMVVVITFIWWIW